MAYQVLARKWRPKSFGELVGQDHVAQTLINALRSGRLPQALLFSGARGVGKTSSARIFAKSLRCPHSKDFVPCNQCETCEEIAQGRHLDVIEIDGASNNGVDAIRELRDSVGFMPASGKYKVYIIDEVHMLSTSAFNALLKTLEEPPPHVVFIFATTEPQKIPVTILSRCQRFDFRRIPTRQIVERLEKICQAEQVQYESEALWIIARQAEGALRDSQSLLDQAITFCQSNITSSQVTSVLGLTDRALLAATLKAITSRDMQACLNVIEQIYAGGFDPGVFVQDFLELVRHAVMIRSQSADVKKLVDLADSEIEEIRKVTSVLSPEDMHMIFDMTLKGSNDLVRSQNPRVVLEMLLMRMCQAPRLTEISKLLQSAPTSPLPTAEEPPKSSQSSSESSAGRGLQEPPRPQLKPGDWAQFVNALRPLAPLIAAKLEYVALLEESPARIRLGVREQLMLAQLGEAETKKKIETFLKNLWGFQGDLTIELMKAQEGVPLSLKEQESKKQDSEKQALLQQVQEHPAIQKTQSVFKTKITSIKERP